MQNRKSYLHGVREPIANPQDVAIMHLAENKMHDVIPSIKSTHCMCMYCMRA